MVGVFSLYQCSDEDLFVASAALEPAFLEVDAASELVLDPAFSNTTAINFSWQAADYDQPTQINYSLEMSGSADFAEPIPVSGTTQRSIALNVSELNNAAGDAGLDPFTSGTLYARLVSSIGSGSNLAQTSNVVSFDVFPYTTEKPRLYVVGDYQAVSGYGTENATAPTLASTEFGSETNYEGFVYFGGENIEYTLHRAGFVGEYVEGNPIYGNDGTGNAVEGATEALTVENAGFYLMRVNLETGSVNLTATDWGIAGPGGPSGGWPDNPPDANMTYDIENQLWVFDNASTGSGEFKFRANDAWDLNFGKDDNNDGSLDFGGPNFENTIGASRFTLDLSNPRAYSFSISAQ